MIKTINKAFQYRLYPTVEQEKVLTSHFGQARFVYNYFLRQRIDYYATNKGQEKQSLNYHDTAKMLTELKQQPDTVWLQESNSQALQQSLRHLDNAYNHFFNHGFKFPNFKKKSRKQSFSVPQNFNIDTKMKQLNIPKLTPIKIVLHRGMEGTMKNVTVSKAPSGKYFASVLCEIEKDVKPKKEGKETGIDLGLKSFLVTSENESIEPPKFLRKSEDKLKHLQQLLSRKVKGSNRRNKARIKVARIHETISNQRNDFLHKLSHRLVSENQAIFAEDLHVKGMIKNHCLAKSIADASWSEFIRQVKYKSEWNGVYFGQTDRFFPSSKRCFKCGWINESLTLADREWPCQGCGQVVDRDFNASQNILQFGKLSTVGQDMSKPLKRPGRPRAIRRVAELGSRLL
ncbi:MAG: RNA-guided endonuclease TnpB family protein [Bacillota bacterium]|nr:RNA-guided endonuclease TnpB family protein [Bacillota bacterium]